LFDNFQRLIFFIEGSVSKLHIKGTVSRKLRHRLLYIIRKLSL